MKNSPSNSGFSLVEVTLALGIAAFTLIAIFGLMPLGMNAAHNATEATVAANAASTILADLRNTPMEAWKTPAISTSQAYKIPLQGGEVRLDEGGRPIGTSGGRYRATIKTVAPTGTSREATLGMITITWPADAAVNNALGRFETFFALDKN